MNIRSKIFFAMLTLIAMIFCKPASADPIITFSIDNGLTFSNTFVVEAGSSTVIDIFLIDTAGTILADEDLLGFGLRGATTTSSGVISSAAVDDIFDFKDSDTFTATGIEWEASAFSNPAPSGPNVELGSFQFDSTGDGTSVFNFTDRTPGTTSAEVNWLTGLGNELDQRIFPVGTGSYQLNIVAGVPEPGSMTVLLLVGVAGTLRRRRKS
ncbi:MAG: PEP-CTERM sorting domain-containing protein [Mariniblastus sp.]